MKEAIIQRILDEKVVAIVRGYTEEECLNLAKALHAGGVNLMEVTFDQKSHEERLRTVRILKMLNQDFCSYGQIGILAESQAEFPGK